MCVSNYYQSIFLSIFSLKLLQIALGKVKGWPKAADMRQLKWSDELAVVAQRHADQCTFAHDKFKQRYECEEVHWNAFSLSYHTITYE